MSTNTGGTAFPIIGNWGVSERGMTLRDYFAAKAMQALITCGSSIEQVVAQEAYTFADAMLKAREQ